MRTALTLLAAIAPMISARGAAADPVVARVLTAPTAWLPPGGAITGTAGSDHRGDGSALVGYGLGGIAAVELGTDTDVRTCRDCTGRPDARWFGRAAFRVGAPQDAWFDGMPAVVIGLRNTFLTRGFGPFDEPRVTEGYVVVSRVVGPVRVHGGAQVVAAGFADRTLSPRLRPLGGLEWTPAQYPKTTLMGDVAWTARLEYEPEPSARRGPQVEWLAAWGVRYQALSWGSVELAVRHRQDEGLSGSTVLVRVNGIFASARGRSPGR